MCTSGAGDYGSVARSTGGDKGRFLTRRETDLREREEFIRTREVQVRSIECELEAISKQADDLDLWSNVATGKHKPLYIVKTMVASFHKWFRN